MKYLATLLLIGLTALSAVPTGTPRQVTWFWMPNTNDFGGMTTNQYFTNIVFRLYSVADCTVPTNQWPVIASWLAAGFPAYDGNWTNYVNADGLTRFYLLTAGGVSGQSPFSNLAVWVPIPPSGIIKSVGP